MNKTLGKLNDDGWNGVEATIEKTVYKMFTVKKKEKGIEYEGDREKI